MPPSPHLTPHLSQAAGPLAQAALRGIGQIVFQGNAASGALVLLGVIIAQPLLAAWLAGGALLGTLWAGWRGADATAVRDGLYGFNAGLAGLAAGVFLAPGPGPLALAAAAVVLAGELAAWGRRRLALPLYTAPFLIATGALLALAAALGLPPAANLAAPPAVPQAAAIPFVASVNSALLTGVMEFGAAALAGVGQVVFVASPWSGVCILAALALGRWRPAAATLAGAVCGTLLALAAHLPAASIGLGLYGYNSALAALALSGANGTPARPLAGAVLAWLLLVAWGHLWVPALTAPFVLAVWLCRLAPGRAIAQTTRQGG